MKKIIAFYFFILSVTSIVNAQCTLTDAACSGTEMAASGAVTIPSGETYIISSGNTSSATVTFGSAASRLCIRGTWTGKPAGFTPGGGTVDVYGAVTNATAWLFTGGSMTLNVHIGGNVTINSLTISGATFTIVNCANIFFTASSSISSTSGTLTINNYASININGSISASNAGFTFNNNAGSQTYIGGDFSFAAGTYINRGKLCVGGALNQSGGTLTNHDCIRISSYSISSSTVFTNNNYMTIVGDLLNGGGTNTNNGTLVITGNYSGTGNFTLGSGSLLTCVDWSLNGTYTGPGSGCAQIRVTGASGLFGTISAANSSRVYFYDSGTPSGGFDLDAGTQNSTNLNNNGCSPTSYPACTMAGSACTTVLPITLVDFSVHCIKERAKISWRTASETNNDFFTIEKTSDGVIFEAIGTVESKASNGNSTQLLEYSFIDNSFQEKTTINSNTIIYYRLKQTDFDGNFSYSNIQFSNCSLYSDCIKDITVVNGSNKLFTVYVSSTCSAEINLSVYDILGRLITTKRERVEIGNNSIQLVSNNVIQGIYILKLNTEKQSFEKKIKI